MTNPPIEAGDWIVFPTEWLEGNILRRKWGFGLVDAIGPKMYLVRRDTPASQRDTRRRVGKTHAYGPFMSPGEAEQLSTALNEIASAYRETKRTLLPKFEQRMTELLNNYRPDGEE